MARKTRITFNFSWIIFMIIGYNLFFSDDNKSTEVNVVDQDKPAIVETIKDAGKEISTVVKSKTIEIIDQMESKKETETETPPEKPEEKRSPVMVAEPEKESLPESTPVDNQPPEKGMKKL